MKIKTSAFVFMVLIVALVSSMSVFAESPNYNIKGVLVNDIPLSKQAFNNLDVERGDVLEIEVVIQAAQLIENGLVDDVRVEAKILGYEFGSVFAVSGLFSVEEGGLYKKDLTLQIPYDIDSSEEYTLRVEVSDPVDEEQFETTLRVDERRHDINIFDLLMNPSNTIKAGKPLFVTVRVENLGEKKEENVKVTAMVPELGISASNFIEELVSQIQEDTEIFREDEESSRQIDLLLRVPEDAPSGDYNLVVEVEYNRGHSVVTATRRLSVEGIQEQGASETVVNIDSTSRKASVGQEVSYGLMIANLGNEKGIYTIQLDGTSPWAEARVEPSFLNILPESTGQARVYVTPSEDAETKDYVFIARVLLGNEVVNEIPIHTNVEGKASATIAFKNVLATIFIVLIVVLIVLGLVIAYRKSRDKEEEPSTVAEGQTYYYVPKK
jgi:uncharacterized membrane protein